GIRGAQPDVGERQRPLEGVEVSKSFTNSTSPALDAGPFWQDRPVLVTGATGLVGAWLVKVLRGAGADVVCLVRDHVPQSDLVRSRTIDQVKVVRGDVRDQSVLERTLGE